MDSQDLIARSARSVLSLAPSIRHLESVEVERADALRGVERGFFRPEEEGRLRAWFARYLTAREGLLETIEELAPIARGADRIVDDSTRMRAFVIGYTAACLLIRAARFLVMEFATHKIIQRKLNEASSLHRFPRKQYTQIYRSLTSPRHAWRIAEAMRFAEAHRRDMDALADDPQIGKVVRILHEVEDSVRIGMRRYLKARVRYRWHAWRRRRASAVQQALFRLLEASGRVVADIHNPWHRDRVTDAVRAELAELLRPGDVIIARHDHALSNLFLPGYWPHAALHVGLPSAREALGLTVVEPQLVRWIDPLRVLEARKDGVLFRALDDTFSVDAFAVIRPCLADSEIARAVSSGITHEGKLYNFDFDFFTDDRLVCTEVVYRAYEGVGGIEFRLHERSGRPTLSAEDLLDMAMDDRGFEPIAIFGTPQLGARLVVGPDAREALRRSYRD